MRHEPTSPARRLIALSCLACLASAFACEVEQKFVAPLENSTLVLHAVLSPNGFRQTMLLERTWDGRNAVRKYGIPQLLPPYDMRYDSANPVVTGGGIPELLAEIEVTTPSGQTVPAIEERTPSGQSIGGGRYYLPLAGMAVAAGGRFMIHVRTATGEELFSEATVPHYLPMVPMLNATFDRVRDTLRLQWSKVSRARAYQVVVQNPFVSFRLFTESTFVRLTGDLRNVNAEGLPHLFFPGFTQIVNVHAVDSNYYEYYRGSNDGLVGAGIRSRVDGGYGVFGAALPVARRRLEVHAPFLQPLEGTYRLLGTAADSQVALILGLTLNVLSEAPGARAAVSGSFRARPLATAPFFARDSIGAFLGQRWKDSIRLAFLSEQRLTDTIEVFRARIAGDTLIGSYRLRAGTWRLIKTQ